MEIEAKYRALDEKFSGLLEVNKMGDYRLGNIEDQVINDRYIDTSDYDMLKAGFALRIREKNGEYLVTIKGLGDLKGVIHRRQEYEMKVEQETEPEDWPAGKVKDMMLSIIGSRPLKELFVIHQFRRIRPVHNNERLVGNMSLDIVDMDLCDEIMKIYEVEMELGKDGTMEDLGKMDHIFRSYGLCPETRSKFQRALEVMKL